MALRAEEMPWPCSGAYPWVLAEANGDQPLFQAQAKSWCPCSQEAHSLVGQAGRLRSHDNTEWYVTMAGTHSNGAPEVVLCSTILERSRTWVSAGSSLSADNEGWLTPCSLQMPGRELWPCF
jgi:hypothetical protein